MFCLSTVRVQIKAEMNWGFAIKLITGDNGCVMINHDENKSSLAFTSLVINCALIVSSQPNKVCVILATVSLKQVNVKP